MNHAGATSYSKQRLFLISALLAGTLILLVAAATASARSRGAVNSLMIVNTLDDGADAAPNDCVCATSDNLCSLRAALQTANACPGPDVIHFAITGTIAPFYALPPLADATGGTTIDGYSAPGASPNTAPLTAAVNTTLTLALDGRQLAFDGLTITSNDNVVRGLAIYDFDSNIGAPYYNAIVISGGQRNVIAGNFLGLTAAGSQGSSFQRAGVNIRALAKQNTIGGATAADRNVISGNRYAGVRIEGNLALTNTVQGNLIGPAPTGTTVLTGSQQLYGVLLTNIAYGNQVLDNVISGNSVAGVVISDSAGDNQVQGNLIGPAASGDAVLSGSMQNDGVWINTSASNNLVQGNLISGNRANGVRISGSSTFDNDVWGNTIGPALAGGALPGSLQAVGVRLSDGATTNRVGNGDEASASNRIAFQTLTAVIVEGSSSRYNRVRRNDLAGNGPSAAAPGIDLGGDGITPDDVGDGDAGPNGLQNRPVISNITSIINQVQVDLLVDSSASNALYPLTVDFYKAETGAAADQVAAGQTWIGSALYSTPQTVTTQRFTAAVIPGNGDLLVATATDAAGNTSEFSRAAPVSQTALGVNDLGDAPDADPGDCLCAAAPGVCTLRAALQTANACPGPQAIGFAVAGTIAPQTPLPALTNPAGIWIDGTSAPGARANSAPLSSPINAQLVVTLNGSGQVPEGLRLSAGRNRINGLAMIEFTGRALAIQSSNNVVSGNFIGLDTSGASGSFHQLVGVAVENGAANNQIGGRQAADRNLISGNLSAGVVISGTGSSFNAVIGNSIGLDATGAALPNAAEQQVGVWIGGGAASNRIGLAAPMEAGYAQTASSNLISGNRQAGIYLGAGASQTQVMNNTIGPAADGQSLVVGGAQTAGVLIEDAQANEIGRLGQANQISGNDLAGVRIKGSAASQNRILANLIGPGTSATQPLPGSHQQNGIVIEEGAHDNQVGDTASALLSWPGNIVRYNSYQGIIVRGATTLNNRLSGNIVMNGPGPAIDLGGDGLTPNDTGDPDEGPNRLQNTPELLDAVYPDAGPGGPAIFNPISITYRVDSALINASYPITIEFFRADSMASGQALSYLGATSYTAPNAQSAVSVLMYPIQPTNFWWPIVATATDGQGNTSELSPPICPGAHPDVNRSGRVDIVDIMLIAHLLGRTPSVYDSNCDGVLDVIDLRAAAAAWQPGAP
ncbi:beta strand repeat-containing protein [Candidatus Amarolinea aalborgensis]|uniref:beta strand repeat-containing protein n=1 Tax=Candidatus Amarolinea aalborgensis TaxID=2249329 RepID=UPI003BF9CE85